jgi:hypothetical protein
MKLNYDGGGVAKTVSGNALDRVVDGDKVTLGLLLPVDNDWAKTHEPRQLPIERAAGVRGIGRHRPRRQFAVIF